MSGARHLYRALCPVPWWMLGGAAASQGTSTGGRPVPEPGCGGLRAVSRGGEIEACGWAPAILVLLIYYVQSVNITSRNYLKSVNVEAREHETDTT